MMWNIHNAFTWTLSHAPITVFYAMIKHLVKLETDLNISLSQYSIFSCLTKSLFPYLPTILYITIWNLLQTIYCKQLLILKLSLIFLKQWLTIKTRGYFQKEKTDMLPLTTALLNKWWLHIWWYMTNPKIIITHFWSSSWLYSVFACYSSLFSVFNTNILLWFIFLSL